MKVRQNRSVLLLMLVMTICENEKVLKYILQSINCIIFAYLMP
jgi:hypothetical protein